MWPKPEFDSRVRFRSIIEDRFKSLKNDPRVWDRHSGYYITKDDDGIPIAIFFPTNSPSNIATDSDFLLEIQKIQSFTAHWRKGAKSSFGQDPFADIPSISVIICTGRWHRTLAPSVDPFRPVLSLSISNEKLWNQGLYYKGIHIGTKDDEITGEYDWWSYARAEVPGASVDTNSTPVHTATSKAHITFATGLLRATVRSVEESVWPILAEDVRRADPEAQLRYQKYLWTALRRGANKYGRASVQYRVLRSSVRWLKKNQITAMMGEQWAPSWETMMRLDHDKQELGPVQPPVLPRTLRRRRLLHPRPAPASTTSSVSTDRLPEAQGHRMTSIFSPDIAPVTDVGGSSGVENPGSRPESTPRASRRIAAKNRIKRVLSSTHYASSDMTAKPETGKKSIRPVSTPRASQQQDPKHRIRRILSPVDYASHNTTEKSETGENSARRVSTPWTTSRPHNPGYVPKGLLSALSATRPELEVDTSALEAAGRDWVNFRRSFRSRRSKEKKSHTNPRLVMSSP